MARAAKIFPVEPPDGRITIRIPMTGLRLFSLLAAFAVLLVLAGCEEMQTGATSPNAATIPNATPTPPPGYWNGDGVPGEPRIVVYLSEQRAYFFKGKQLVGESTVSTGKQGFSTPPGRYRIVSKDRDHVSSEFGDYVDEEGNVVKANVDVRKDSRPRGSHFSGARMPYCMHFNGGYAMHQGYVPPYAASHGCIRLPETMAQHFFDAAAEGTPMIVKR